MIKIHPYYIVLLLMISISMQELYGQDGNSAISPKKTINFKNRKSTKEEVTKEKDSQLGVSNASIFPSRKKAVLDWVYPTGSNIDVSGGAIEIALKIQAPESILKENIKVYNNGKLAGSKADEVELIGNGGEFNFTYKVSLTTGANKIEVAVESPDIKRKSSALLIYYENGRAVVSSEKQESSNEKKLSAFWKSPDPIMLNGKSLVYKKMDLDFSIGISSDQPLTKDNLTLSLNNNDVSPTKSGVLYNSGNSYTYTDQIILDDQISINEVFVRVTKGTNIAKTSTLKINYTPVKPNLYVLSIGVKSNLQYPVNDANDFVDIFKSQGGRAGNRLFNSIQTEKLLGENATAEAIRRRMIDLKIKMETGNINNDDLILVFISSHGFIMDSDFRIEGNDYEPRYKDLSSVSYQKDILARLNEIPCKKIVFIDACHSGGAKADAANINDALLEYKRIPAGMSLIASSQEDEQSYEDDAWENGAFTEAISRGLIGGEADSNENKIITVLELYNYILSEVPEIVYAIKGKVQRPAMPKKDLDNIGIFVLPD